MAGHAEPSTPSHQPTDPASPAGLVWRALALFVIVAAVDQWARYHLGWPLRSPGGAAGIIIVVGAALKTVDLLLGRRPLEAARDQAQEWFAKRLTWARLGVVALLLAVGSGFVTSVTVRPGAADDVGHVRLAGARAGSRVAERELDPDRPEVRFPVLTTPWGRDFVVNADGYASGTFRAYPVLGRQIRLAHDLARTPSLLFRPGPDGISLLGDGAVFTLSHVDDAGREELLAADSSGRQASFLVGIAPALADSVVARWRSELRALGASDADADVFVRLWRDPTAVRPQRGLPSDGMLVARIGMHGIVVSEAAIRLRPQRLLDPLMVPPPDR